jgi:hypothetical protein
LEGFHEVSELQVFEGPQNIRGRDTLVLLPFGYFMSAESDSGKGDTGCSCETYPAAGMVLISETSM